MAQAEIRELVAAAAGAVLSGDVEGFIARVDPGIVEEYPQSRERLRGSDSVRRVLTEHPAAPRMARPPRVTALGEEHAAVEARVHYGDEPWWLVSLFEGRSGRLIRERAYFGRSLEAQPWRAAWVTQIPDEAATSDAGGHDAVERDLAERYVRAQATSDFDTLSRLRHEQFVHDMPQSGERFPSVRAYTEAHERYPGGLPTLEPLSVTGPEDQWVIAAPGSPLRVSGSGAHWVGEAELRYPDGERWIEVLFMDFAGRRVVAERSYWFEPFEPPAWREGLSERY